MKLFLESADFQQSVA